MPINVYDIDVCPRYTEGTTVVIVSQLKRMILDECKKSEFPSSSFYRILQVIEDAEGLPVDKRITPKHSELGIKDG